MMDQRIVNLTLQEINIFLVAAKYENYTRAAQELHLVQSSISRSIRSMEDSLGLVLFTNFKRNVKLTPAGRFLAESLSNQLPLLQHTLDEAYEIQRCNYNHLSIADTNSSSLEKYLLKIISRFRADNPEVDLALSRLTPAEVITGLDEGKYDIGILPKICRSIIEKQGYQFRNFINMPPSIILSSTHKAFQKKDLSYQDCLDSEIIMLKGGILDVYYDVTMQIMKQYGFSPDNIRIIDNPNSIPVELMRGDSISFMDEFFNLEENIGLRYIPLYDCNIQYGFDAVFSDNNKNRNIQKLLNCIDSLDLQPE